MAEPFAGYKSVEDFQKALDRELREMSSHDRSAPEREAQPKKAFRSKAGTKERIAEAARIAGINDQDLLNAVGRHVDADKLLKVVRQLQRDGFNVEAVQQAVALTMELDRADVAQLVAYNLDEASADLYESTLMDAIVSRNEKAERDAEKAEAARVENREKLLTDEYDFAERLGGEDVLGVVDLEAQEVGDGLYDPLVSDEEIRLRARQTAFAAKGVLDADRTMRFHQALDQEILAGQGRPGSSWNDEQRERWEADLALSTVEAREQATPELPEVLDQAVQSMQPNSFQAEFEAELDRLSTPPAHQQRLRDENVKAYEAEHPEQ